MCYYAEMKITKSAIGKKSLLKSNGVHHVFIIEGQEENTDLYYGRIYSNTIHVHMLNVKIVDDLCSTVEDFKQKYPEEFM